MAESALRGAEVPDPEVDARLLLSHVTGIEPLQLLVDSGSVGLSDDEQRDLSAILRRRTEREPLQYITEEAWFMGRAFKVSPDVLIPRQDTECLCESVLSVIGEQQDRVLDIGTGSGALAVTIAIERPSAAVTAIDISSEALAIAAWNAKIFNVNVRFLKSDFYSGLEKERYDVIVSNPPYIPTCDLNTLQKEVLKEPPVALDGGKEGLDAYRRIKEGLDRHLRQGGTLALELGDGEADAVKDIFIDCFESFHVVRDLSGFERVLMLEKFGGHDAGKA